MKSGVVLGTGLVREIKMYICIAMYNIFCVIAEISVSFDSQRQGTPCFRQNLLHFLMLFLQSSWL